MSPQPADSDVRRRLIETAARVLGEDGPSGLSTRKLAAEVGTSTMAVYTHFGGLPGLVEAVVDEGFARLAAHLAAAAPNTGDALVDLGRLATAYRDNALENPHLYGVMFGSASLGGFRRSGDELTRRRDTFDVLVAATRRAMDEGLLADGDAESVAAQLWSALHGYVMLELAGFMTEADAAPEKVLWPMLGNLVTALRAPPPSPTSARRRSRSPGPAAGRSRKSGSAR